MPLIECNSIVHQRIKITIAKYCFRFIYGDLEDSFDVGDLFNMIIINYEQCAPCATQPSQRTHPGSA